jgi:hypothetical protein
MAIYRNSVTGVVIDTPCKVSGPNWSRVTKNAAAKAKQDEAPAGNKAEDGQENEEE